MTNHSAPLRRSSVITLAGFFAAALPMLAIGWLPATAQAAEPPVSLLLVPLGQPQGYFDVTMAPGETKTLDVELLNSGQSSIEARSYAADVYTIVNGGFGAKTAADAASGTTTWLTYPTTVESLAAGESVRRTATVTVPASARPGDYISSLVIENATPASAAGGLDQTVRTAVAVSIRVPGRMRAGVRIGPASQSTSDGHSVVDVHLSNTGAELLKPTATVLVRDTQGSVLGRFQVAMGSFYAHTSTNVEVALPKMLQVGDYRVDVRLTDASHRVDVDRDATPLTVGGASAASVPDGHAMPVAILLTVTAVLLLFAAIVIAVYVVVRGRRREHREERV